MNFASCLTLIVLLTGTLFISGESLKCFRDCQSYYKPDGTKYTSCKTVDEIACNGSCFQDHQTTFKESNNEFGWEGLAAVGEDNDCSPLKMADGCVPFTSDRNPEVTKRCFCNTDLCY